jgi:hypothetical protein
VTFVTVAKVAYREFCPGLDMLVEFFVVPVVEESFFEETLSVDR